MSLDILSQFPSPPVPNLPAMAMAINAVLPQHQQPIMTQPPVSMAMPVTAPPVMGMTPNPPAQPTASFITNFPPVQVNIRHFITDNKCVLLLHKLIFFSLLQATKADDDDFQDFQEAPKASAGDDSFTDFQGETGGAFPSMKSSSQSGYDRCFLSSYFLMSCGILSQASESMFYT